MQLLSRGDSMPEIKWIAQYHAKDDINERIIKLGIRQEKIFTTLTWIYFDFDVADSDMCENSDEEAIKLIEENWGNMNTFEWIKS